MSRPMQLRIHVIIQHSQVNISFTNQDAKINLFMTVTLIVAM